MSRLGIWYHSASKAVGQSPALLLAAFSAMTVVGALSVPPKMLDPSDGVPSTFKPMVQKVSNFLSSKENPEVVVLGSSLVLVPAVRCDDKVAGKPVCRDQWYYFKHIPEYTEARYLQRELSNRTGLAVKIKNMGVMSSLMSDHASILDEMLAQGKRPRLVICGIAPRDFLDNSQKDFDQTPTRMLLSEFHADGNFLPSGLTVNALQDCYKRDQHQLQKVIARIRTVCSDLVCQLTGNPVKLQYTNSTARAAQEGEGNLLKDLDSYKREYNPPNYKMLATQTQRLETMLDHARHAGVKVLLVNMPLTQPNYDALDKAAYAAYVRNIQQAADRNDAVLLDIASSSAGHYNLNDFEDCSHLNTRGGFKMYESLLSALTSDRRLTRRLGLDETELLAECASASSEN